MLFIQDKNVFRKSRVSERERERERLREKEERKVVHFQQQLYKKRNIEIGIRLTPVCC